MPRHDIDPLAAQLTDHRLHARALQPHARTHRIDRLVTGPDRDLRPPADLARNALDLHDPLVDLRHLELEQRRHEQRVRPGQDQTRALRRLLHPLQYRANRLALPEALPRILLLPRDDRVRFPRLVQHHHELAALDLLDLAREQVPDLARILIPDLLALALPDPLDDPLLRGHHRVASELPELDRDLHHVPDLVLGVVPARLLQRDLTRRILDLGHDLLEHRDLDVTRILVDLDLGLHRRTEPTRQGRHDPIPDQVVQVFPGKILVRDHLPERRQHLRRIRHRSFRPVILRARADRASARVLPPKYQMRPRDFTARHLDLFSVLEPEPYHLFPVPVHQPQQFALEAPPPAGQRSVAPDRDLPAREALPVAPLHQRSLHAGRRDFEHITATRPQLCLVQQRFDRPAHPRTVFNGHTPRASVLVHLFALFRQVYAQP